MDTREKILDAAEMPRRFAKDGFSASTLVVAKGLFDILRPQHCRRLADARQPGAALAAIVYADGDPRRTVLDQQTRAELAASLAAVDAVVICGEDEADALARSWNPRKVVDIDEPALPDLIADVLQRHGSN